MWAAILIALAFILILNAILASSASDIANDKGYDKSTWFQMCFWLGPIPYIIIAAMPDLTTRNLIARNNQLLENLVRAQNDSSEAGVGTELEDVSSLLPEL